MKIQIVSLLLLCVLSCSGQTPKEIEWKSVESTDAGLRASFPCVPKLSNKSFQDNPRPIHVYDFECEVEGLRFLLTVKNHLNEFSSKTISDSFEANEFILKEMFGAINFSVKNGTTNGYHSRQYDRGTKSGGKIRCLIVVNKFATYEVLIGIIPEYPNVAGQRKLEFFQASEKFLDSVEVLTK